MWQEGTKREVDGLGYIGSSCRVDDIRDSIKETRRFVLDHKENVNR